MFVVFLLAGLLQLLTIVPETGGANLPKREEPIYPKLEYSNPYEIPWDKRKLYYSFKSYSKKVSRPEARLALRRAFNDWTAISGLKFVKVNDNDTTADVKVSFAEGEHGDGFPFHGVGVVLAHAFFPYHGALHFDDAEKWALGTHDHKTDLIHVARHEIGHLLGLMHSNNSDSIMFAMATDENKLKEEDQRRIRELYGYPLDHPLMAGPLKKIWMCARYTRKYKRFSASCPATTPDAIVGGPLNRIYVFRPGYMVTTSRDQMNEIRHFANTFPGMHEQRVSAATFVRNRRELHLYTEIKHYAYTVDKDEKMQPVRGYPKKITRDEMNIVGSFEIRRGPKLTETLAILKDGRYASYDDNNDGSVGGRPLGKLSDRFPGLPSSVITAVPGDHPDHVVVFTSQNNVYEYSMTKQQTVCGPMVLHDYLKCNVK